MHVKMYDHFPGGKWLFGGQYCLIYVGACIKHSFATELFCEEYLWANTGYLLIPSRSLQEWRREKFISRNFSHQIVSYYGFITSSTYCPFNTWLQCEI